ncbi:MAG: hypothetical protein ACJA2Y_000647 [Cycloclasticus pugetii]|jgi:hypothetical protein|uniref:hypothetical protein n=1 Tax=Cycloclasticus pugetii TaxID=34068 RepID=UPI0039E628BD
MPEYIKGFGLNTLSGIVSGVVAGFLINHGLTYFGYIAFSFYIVLAVSVAYYHIRNSQIQLKQASTDNVEESNIDKGEHDILHHVLSFIAKHQTLEQPTSPSVIAKSIGVEPNVLLAHMVKFHNEQLITFRNGGKQPELNTSFILSPKAWQHISITNS